MAILARKEITLTFERDISATYRFYKLQASTATPPAKPTSITTLPPSGWSNVESDYTEGSTNTLYTVDLTVYTDGTFDYKNVMKSSSYEAAKSAYNKAVAAQNTATAAQESIDNLEIGGRNLIINTLYPDVSTNDSRPRIFGQESYTVTRSTPTVAEHGMRTTNPSGVTSYPYVRFGPASGAHIGLNGLTPGETYTFSSDISWKTLSNYTSGVVRKMQISVYVATSGGTTFEHLSTTSISDITPGVEQSARGIHTFTLPEDATAMYIIIRDSTAGSNYSLEGDFLELANIKLEKGNRATDWTPAPEDHELSIADSRSWYAECASEGADTTKIATITPATDLFTLRPGVMVAVKFSAKNSGAVGSLKLNVNGTGEKSIKYINNNTIGNLPGADYILADRTYQFYYDGTYWIIQINYNSNTNYYDRIRFQVNITAKSAIAAKNIIVAGSDGKYFHLKSNTAFDITYPILYAVDKINAGATGTNNYLAFYFAIATTQNLTMTANKAVYIKGTLNGTTFTPISTTPLTQTVPTSADGYHYIRLGMAYTDANIYMDTDHSVYVYNSGGFKTTAQIAEEARTRVQAMFNNLNGVDQFNTLTQNGALNGIFYSDSGNAYINAAFIQTESLAADKIAVSDLNAFSATIGGFQIDNKVNEQDTTTISSIHTAGVAVTSNADNSVALASDLFTRTLGGIERQNLKFAIGSRFGIGNDGTLYATNGNFTGTISGSKIIFGDNDGKIETEYGSWYNHYHAETFSGVKFHGAGGIGFISKVFDVNAGGNGITMSAETDEENQHAEIRLWSESSFTEIRSSMSLDSYNGAHLHSSSPKDESSNYISGFDCDSVKASVFGTNIYISAEEVVEIGKTIKNYYGGYIGYAGYINSSGSLANWWTQGQYSVSGATGRPAKSNAYGILLSFMGNSNDDSYTDDYAHSWGLQLYSDNDQLYYRTKTKTGATTWRSTFVSRKDFTVVLSQLTWNTTGSGMYYSSNLLSDSEVAYWDHIDSVSLTSGWQSLRKTDNIIPYINGTNVALMSNVNSFSSATGSKVTVRVAGRRGVSNS